MSACVVEGQVPSWREADRLTALRDFGILDSESEPAFDEIARLAARICHAPIALVSLVDEQRQWFKCEIGLSGVRETAREVAICSHAILQSNLFIVPDTTKDPRFRDNPLVTGEPHLRFYAGAPLITDQGLPLGTLCVLDSKPRAQGLTPEQADALLTLSRAVMGQLKLRKANNDLHKQKAELVALLDGLPQVLWSFGPGGRDNHNNKRWYEFTGAVPGSAQEKGWVRLIHPEDQERVSAVWQHAVETGSPYEIEHRLRHHSGEYRWVLARTVPLRDDQGRIKRWLGTGTDIHEAKQTQQALAEREEFTRRLLSSSDDCIKVLDLDGKLRSMSEGGLRVMEVDNFSRIEGCHWPDFWTGSTAEQAQVAIETAQAGGTGRFQGFCPTMAGTPKWWDVLVTAIKGPEGKPERLLSISRDITDQKKTEQALRESEHRYRALVEASATIVWRATPDGSIVDGSTEWEAITGQSPEAFKGFGWLSAVHPDDGERVISHWQDILASRRPGTNEFRVQHLSGAYKWFATKAVPLLNADGTVQEWVGTITDIHEQKTASERIRVSEERYRALIDASATVVWRARPDGAVVQGWGWETFCGQRPEGFQGYGWLDNVHPDDREGVISAWQAALAARQPSVAEYRIRRFDGEYRWSLTRAVPLLGSDGTVQEWVGAITDIHEQKTASEIIRQREEQHRALLEASSVVLWLATPDGMITETRGWREVTGQEDSESVGLGSADTLHPDDKDRTVRAWQTAVLRGMPYENECRVRQKDGTYRWMLTRAVPLRNPDGSIREWVGGLSDIHGRKQAEESLRTSEERLRLALQAGRMAALELDLRTNIISRHHNTIDLLGIESSSLSDFMEQVHPDD
jgi:PAS domain S-box-containing protein